MESFDRLINVTKVKARTELIINIIINFKERNCFRVNFNKGQTFTFVTNNWGFRHFKDVVIINFIVNKGFVILKFLMMCLITIPFKYFITIILDLILFFFGKIIFFQNYIL